MTAGLIQARAAHAAALAAIHAASFPPSERWDAAALAGQLALPGVFGVLHPDGGMVMARVAADEAEILTLGVSSPARRRGLGRALLHAAHTQAGDRGALKMFLEVAPANAAARALYAAFGYRIVGQRQAYYDDGTDALVLRCDLTPDTKLSTP